ncbi:MAG: hypothetical protein U9O56_03475 [Campylobacterota bacterium]|nr:hypothetical protein [Campylobacterota bacterium]
MTIGKKIPTTPTQYSQEEQSKRKELRDLEKCYIWIYTDFKRPSGCPIFVLALSEGARRVEFSKERLLFKSDKEILDIVSTIVQEHYQKVDGKIQLWGTIISYIWHDKSGNKYTYNPDGSYSENSTIDETKATLSIKGKQIC